MACTDRFILMLGFDPTIWCGHASRNHNADSRSLGVNHVQTDSRKLDGQLNGHLGLRSIVALN
jgi:hypothetical protein